jgi:non-specific serine/threonine protein kinase
VLFRQLGTKLGIAELLDILGRDARREHDYQRAGALLGESLTLYQELGHWRCLGFCLEDFAGIAATRAEAQCGSEAQALALRAARLFGAAEALIGTDAIDPAEHDRCVAAVRAALGEAVAKRAWAEGRAMPLEDALAYALADPARGEGA